jgi:hypothetical protein
VQVGGHSFRDPGRGGGTRAREARFLSPSSDSSEMAIRHFRIELLTFGKPPPALPTQGASPAAADQTCLASEWLQTGGARIRKSEYEHAESGKLINLSGAMRAKREYISSYETSPKRASRSRDHKSPSTTSIRAERRGR